MKYWDAPWNPEIGCTACSPGCRGCYANTLHTQRHKALLAGKKMPECYREPFNVIQLLEDRLDIPLRRRIPTVYFVCDMGDLFHPKVPFEFIDKVLLSTDPIFSPNHTFLILTKRAERMKKYFEQLYIGLTKFHKGKEFAWPPQNIWLGVTICNQDEKDKIDILRQTPAAHRFLSFEPQLEDLGELNLEDIDQVILGGETGPKARPMHPDWARKVRDQCKEAGVPFFFKQWGEYGVYGPNKHFDVLHWRKKGRIDAYKRTHKTDCCIEGRTDWSMPVMPKEVKLVKKNIIIESVTLKGEIETGIGMSYGSVEMGRIGKKKAGRKLDGEEHNDLAWRLAK